MSHLLPRAIYRWLQRSMAGQKNANPVHVTAVQPTTKSFQVAEYLLCAQPLATITQARIIDARSISVIDLDKLIYFAVSVFWRAGAREWNAVDHRTQLSLGPYQETLRQYLLGQEPFPEQAALIVNVADNPSPHLGAVFPYSNRVNGVWQHRFSIPGMAFWLHLGRFRDQLPALCADRSGVICHVPRLDDNYEREMGALNSHREAFCLAAQVVN